MKGRHIRPPMNEQKQARIVRSLADSAEDVIVPLDYAIEQYTKDKLDIIHIPGYPNSFKRI